MIAERPTYVIRLRPERGVDHPLLATGQPGDEAEAQLREQQATRDDRRIDDIAAQLEEAEQELLEP